MLAAGASARAADAASVRPVVASVAAVAASAPTDGAPSGVAPQTKPFVDEHDRSRVNVQLVVVGLVIGIVVVAGSAAYFVRRRLGLTAYDAEAARAAQESHH